MTLTEHFSFAEVVNSATASNDGIDNSLPEAMMGNALIAAQGMEQVRSLLCHHIDVTSWYRCHALNHAVGGAPGSAHLEAFAVDFVCPEFGTPLAIVHSPSTLVKVVFPPG